jgi:hypothetical protein
VVPAQLQYLKLRILHWPDMAAVLIIIIIIIIMAAVLALQQLQRLTLSFPYRGLYRQPVLRQQVLQFTQLTSLRSLRLDFDELNAAAAEAPMWALLPQLRELSLAWCEHDNVPVFSSVVLEPDYEQQMAAVMAGAAAATQLTSLEIGSYGPGCDSEVYDRRWPQSLRPIAVCASLAGLTGLKRLVLCGMHLTRGDASALTALTGLTYLDLCRLARGESGARVDDEAAAALARSLKQLVSLNV